MALPTRKTQTRTTEFTHGVDIAVDMAVAKAGCLSFLELQARLECLNHAILALSRDASLPSPQVHGEFTVTTLLFNELSNPPCYRRWSWGCG